MIPFCIKWRIFAGAAFDLDAAVLPPSAPRARAEGARRFGPISSAPAAPVLPAHAPDTTDLWTSTRLATEADSYWQTLCTHSCIDNLGNGRGICMEWVVDPIHYVLKDCLNNSNCIPGTTPLNWARGLELLCPKKIY